MIIATFSSVFSYSRFACVCVCVVVVVVVFLLMVTAETHEENRRQFVEVLLYVHRNRGLIRDGSPGRPPRLSHSS